MGILMDTYEDTRFQAGDDSPVPYRSWFLAHNIPLRRYDIPPPVHCPICKLVVPHQHFVHHARMAHRGQHVYLRFNGRIIRDSVEYNRETDAATGAPICECTLCLHGVDFAGVTINSGDTIRYIKMTEFQDMLGYLREGKMTIVTVEIDHETAPILLGEFVICGSEPLLLRNEELDAAVASLQMSVEHHVEPDWQTFRRDWIQTPDWTDAEHQYLEGFYSYTLAAWYESRNDFRRSRQWLETASRRLMPFSTRLALNARAILALRLNAFSFLSRCRGWKVFGLAYSFFVANELWAHGLMDAHGLSRQFDAGQGVFVDAFTSTYLEALNAFYVGDDTSLGHHLSALDRHPLVFEANNRAKYALLQGRSLLRAGHIGEARQFYGWLLSDPHFGAEAKEHST